MAYDHKVIFEVRKSFKSDEKDEFVFDTCHSFSAGYDLSSIQKVRNFYAKVNKLLGWHKVAAIHLNDSNEPFNSRKDRHQNLLLGHIYNDNKRAKGCLVDRA